MAKDRRPFQDDTIYFPILRHLYSRTLLGRAPEDAHPEPTKLTQALHERLNVEAYEEWSARFLENMVGADLFIRGELKEQEEALAKFTGAMAETGLDATIGGMESGDIDAMEGVEKATGALADESGLEMIEDVLSGEVITNFAFSPPVVPLPLSLGPAINVMLYGSSVDVFYNNIDVFTNEQQYFIENYHFEDGIQTAKFSFRYENISDILDRRHMRTGEKFKYICVPRPALEGSLMATDIVKDIRNERTTEYGNSPIWDFPYSTIVIPDSNSSDRSTYDFFSTVIWLVLGDVVNFPFLCYTGWHPRPGILEMVAQLPIDMIVPRFATILTGTSLSIPQYTLTPLETTREVVGAEMIIPTQPESLNSYTRYGMDMPRFPSSYIQSRRLYGQEAIVRVPTEYPCPEKVWTGVQEAMDQVEAARKEHPEWLTSIKGFGH